MSSKRNTTRGIFGLAVIAIVLGTACDTVSALGGTERGSRCLFVFVDGSMSIATADKSRWPAFIANSVRDYGEGLWNPDQSDRAVVLMLHAATRTATPVASAQFPGGEFEDAARRKARTRFTNEVAVLDTLTIRRDVARSTDIVSSIDRLDEYGAPSCGAVHVVYLSDMLNSTPDLDFERSGTITAATAARLATQVVHDRKWKERPLAGYTIDVLLPGTVQGVAGIGDDRIEAVEIFWRTLFEELGAAVGHWQRS